MFKFFKRRKINNHQRIVDLLTFEKREDDVLISVKRTGLREFYDSEWLVDVTIFEKNKLNVLQRFSCNIIRSDDENAVRLEQAIRALGSNLNITELKMLDERKSIYYD